MFNLFAKLNLNLHSCIPKLNSSFRPRLLAQKVSLFTFSSV